MGQKVNPFAIRLGITRDWVSKWYANKKQFPLQVHTDFRVRQFLKAKLADASVSRILIDRAGQARQHHDPDRASGHRDRQEG
jgi:small subunit ribosomal protein S3